jgi:hypothetical protein
MNPYVLCALIGKRKQHASKMMLTANQLLAVLTTMGSDNRRLRGSITSR